MKLNDIIYRSRNELTAYEIINSLLTTSLNPRGIDGLLNDLRNCEKRDRAEIIIQMLNRISPESDR